MDNLTKKQRSYVMSRIKSKWTKPEKIVHNFLKGRKIRHKMHPKISGNPDVLLLDRNIAVFIHGCFWHKCPKCYRPPKSNQKFWTSKIENNIKRDRRNIRLLKKSGLNIVVIWEHSFRHNKKQAMHRLTSVT